MPYNTTTIEIDTSVLDRMIAENPQKFADMVGKTCFRILTKARMITPRDPARPPKDETQPVSGALRANSDVVKDGIGLTQRVEFYQIYAAAQELGNPAGNLPARPYLTPTTEQESQEFVDDLGKVMRDEA